MIFINNSSKPLFCNRKATKKQQERTGQARTGRLPSGFGYLQHTDGIIEQIDYVFLAYHVYYAVAFKFGKNALIDSGQDYSFLLDFKTLDQFLKVIEAGSVNHGHPAHTYNNNIITIGIGGTQLFEFTGYSKEHGTGDFKNRTVGGQFQIDHTHIVVFLDSQISDQRLYHAYIGHTLHKQQRSQNHTYLNGNRKIDYYC